MLLWAPVVFRVFNFSTPTTLSPHGKSGQMFAKHPTRHPSISISIIFSISFIRYLNVGRFRYFWLRVRWVCEFVFARPPHLFLDLLVVRNQPTYIMVKPCYSRGMPKSLQIFLARLLSISVCLGIAVRLPVSALPYHECLLPSRIK